MVKLVNDLETLPDGGYLGIGLLCHQYVYDETKSVDTLLDKLKGSDAVLASVCKELELSWSLKLLYAEHFDWPVFSLLSRVKFKGVLRVILGGLTATTMTIFMNC